MRPPANQQVQTVAVLLSGLRDCHTAGLCDFCVTQQNAHRCTSKFCRFSVEGKQVCHSTEKIHTTPYLRCSFPAGIMCSEALNTRNSPLQQKILFLADMCKPHSSNQVTASIPTHHLTTVTRTKAPCAPKKGVVRVQPRGQSKCPDTTSNL